MFETEGEAWHYLMDREVCQYAFTCQEQSTNILVMQYSDRPFVPVCSECEELYRRLSEI